MSYAVPVPAAGPSAQPLANPVTVVSPQFLAAYPVDLVITEKMMTIKEGAFTVSDVNGNLMFNIKGSLFSLHDRRVLVDNAGNPIVSFRQKVALLKLTGYKIINNISDTGKAFLIILITDIFLGYHSESGWQTLLEIFVEHYGLEVDQSAITIFICLIPVIMDACVKLWMFKFLPRLSPKVTNIFREMKRH